MVNLPHRQSLTDLPPELIEALIDNPYECPIVIDRKGYVRFMSRHNADVYGITPEEAIGKHITQVSKDTRLHEVLKSGKAEIGEAFDVGNRRRIIARIPLKNGRGKLIGVVGKLMFHQADKIKELHQRLEILEGQLKYYRTEVASFKRGNHALDHIVGESPAILKAKKLVLQAATSDSTVLITGESGTGKEAVATAIHANSGRADGPFIRVNCAAIPEQLFESELFGYERGAFTGALSHGKPGKFQLSHGGSIFLDEIGDMPISMQAKLLRVIQDHEIEPVGGTRPVKLDFRVIAATNQDLPEKIKEGTFRADLFYRLNIFHVSMPSLREMEEDVPRLAYYFLSVFREKRHSAPSRISPEAMALLKRYGWPGNIRELKNVLERAMNVAESRQITVEDLPKRIREFYRSERGIDGGVGLLSNVLADAEKRAILEALRIAEGNKVKAAKILGIHRTGLYQKIKRHGLDA